MNRQTYKGYTLDKVSSTPPNIIWEVIKDGEILEGCSSLAYAKQFVRDHIAASTDKTESEA